MFPNIQYNLYDPYILVILHSDNRFIVHAVFLLFFFYTERQILGLRQNVLVVLAGVLTLPRASAAILKRSE